MKPKPIWNVVATGLTALSIFAEAGCSSLGSHSSGLAGFKKKSDNAPVPLGQIESDQYGRPLPGTKSPIAPAINESAPEISDQTRSHVALAMGEMLESVGNLDAAQMQYEQSLKADPKSLNSALALARIYARQGRPDAALKVYQTSEKYHRRNAALFNDKGLLLADQRNWSAAVAALRTAVKLEPSESKYHNNLGMVLATSGNYGEAYKEFREAVGPGPAHYNIALMLLQAERPVEARDHLERALAAMPGLEKAQQLITQLDSQIAASSLASREQEVDVELDHNARDDRQLYKLEAPVSDEVEQVEASVPPEVPKALEAPAVTSKAPRTEKIERSPWARRWVPPKWIR